MLLARTERRKREIAIHAALGASRARLMRPIFLETLLLGAGAGALALGVMRVTSEALLREVPPMAYGRAFVAVDARVAVFALAVGIAAGLFAVALHGADRAWTQVLQAPARRAPQNVARHSVSDDRDADRSPSCWFRRATAGRHRPALAERRFRRRELVTLYASATHERPGGDQRFTIVRGAAARRGDVIAVGAGPHASIMCGPGND
jgi:hypothetical protein